MSVEFLWCVIWEISCREGEGREGEEEEKGGKGREDGTGGRDGL